MKKNRWVIGFLFLGLFATIAYGVVVWNRPDRPVEKEEVGIRIQADSLFIAYATNEKTANTNFLDKAIEVSGKVGSVSKNEDGTQVVFLQTADPMFGVNCTMEESSEAINIGDDIKLKGICTGYTTDVILIRCYLKK